MIQTEYEFTLPIGYQDKEGVLHRDGAFDGIDRTRKIGNKTVAGGIENPAAMRGDVLSASIRTANRRGFSSAMACPLEKEVGGDSEQERHGHQDEGDGAAERPVRLLRELVVDQRRHHLEQRAAQQEGRGVGVHRQDEGQDGAGQDAGGRDGWLCRTDGGRPSGNFCRRSSTHTGGSAGGVEHSSSLAGSILLFLFLLLFLSPIMLSA